MAIDDLVRSRMKKMKMNFSPEESVVKISDAIHKGPGRALGALYEKAKLGGKQGEGRVKFSETPEGKKRAFLKGHKGMFASYGK